MNKEFIEIAIPRSNNANDDLYLLYGLLKYKPSLNSLEKSESKEFAVESQLADYFLDSFNVEKKFQRTVIKKQLVKILSTTVDISNFQDSGEQIGAAIARNFKSYFKKETLSQDDLEDEVTVGYFKISVIFSVKQFEKNHANFNLFSRSRQYTRSVSVGGIGSGAGSNNLEFLSKKTADLETLREQLIDELEHQAETVSKSGLVFKKSEPKNNAILALVNDLKNSSNDFIETIDKHLITDETKEVQVLNQNRARCKLFWKTSTETKKIIRSYYQKYSERSKEDDLNFPSVYR